MDTQDTVDTLLNPGKQAYTPYNESQQSERLITSKNANAWDTVPSIQKYASQLVHQPQPPPLAPAFDEDGWRRDRRKTYRDERAEINSRDWDDEDNADDDDEPAAANSDGESVKSTSNGVLTIPCEKREQAVQPAQDHPRQWAPSSGSNLLAPATIHEMSSGHDSPMESATNSEATQSSPVSEPSHPTASSKLSSLSTAQPRPLMRSPREFVVSPSATGPPAPLLAPTSKPSVQTSAITAAKLPSVIARQSSNESSLNSPADSAGPISQSDGSPVNLTMKKAGRVWDPALGVELFKRESEEVLARFLKVGSWEDESAC